jgi:NitT/TauT family transport system substrate-binding protein
MDRKRVKGLWCTVVLTAAFLSLIWPQAGFVEAKDKVTLKYSWIFTPSVSPFMLGLEKGFFAAEGIDLDFKDGRGSRGNLKLLSTKKLLVGFADAGAASKFITQGLAAKVIFGYQQKSPMSVIAREGLGIKTLKDLEARKVGAAASDSGTAIFPALARRNGVDITKVQMINVTPAARNTALLNKDVDAIIGYWPDNVPFLRSKGAKVNVMSYADNGMNVLGTSSSPTIRSWPKSPTRFAGWAEPSAKAWRQA